MPHFDLLAKDSLCILLCDNYLSEIFGIVKLDKDKYCRSPSLLAYKRGEHRKYITLDKLFLEMFKGIESFDGEYFWGENHNFNDVASKVEQAGELIKDYEVNQYLELVKKALERSPKLS